MAEYFWNLRLSFLSLRLGLFNFMADYIKWYGWVILIYTTELKNLKVKI